MLMNIYSSAKAKPIFFSCLLLFANTETLEQNSEANNKHKKSLEILVFNFAYFLCGYLLSVLTFLILMKISCKVDLSP